MWPKDDEPPPMFHAVWKDGKLTMKRINGPDAEPIDEVEKESDAQCVHCGAIAALIGPGEWECLFCDLVLSVDEVQGTVDE